MASQTAKARRATERPRDAYFLAAAEFHARAATLFEAEGHRAFAALARRREAEARRRAERPRP